MLRKSALAAAREVPSQFLSLAPRRYALEGKLRTRILDPLAAHLRDLHTSPSPRHDNPLGLPRRRLPPEPTQRPTGLPLNNAPPPSPTIPRRGAGGPPQKRKIPGVKHVVVVASGKGGVGKSTVAANLAVSLSQSRIKPSSSQSESQMQPLVGLLDLDIFGPSVPKLFGLENAGEPMLTKDNRLIPMSNHGIQTMSMGYLLPPSANNDNPVVWRGMMVMKAVQQLLFEVDWTVDGRPLDCLVIDMPPGTGDVQLSLGQLVTVDNAIIVSTPQDVALIDAQKGVNMFRKVNIPIIGCILNQSHFICNNCSTPHELFGSSSSFEEIADDMSMDVLGKLPLLPEISHGGDRGVPLVLHHHSNEEKGILDGERGSESTSKSSQQSLAEIHRVFKQVSNKVWSSLGYSL